MGATFDPPGYLAADLAELEQRIVEPGVDHNLAGVSVPKELARWDALAADSAAFWGTVDDYIHELGCRTRLARALEAADWPVRAWLLPLVDAIDERYRESTTLDTRDLMWEGGVDVPSHWWARRLPKDQRLLQAIELVGPEMRVHRITRRNGADG